MTRPPTALIPLTARETPSPSRIRYDPRVGLRHKLSTTFAAIGILVVLFVVALVLIPIGGAVVGQGTVAAESRVKRVAHPVGGVVAEIYVANGDVVRRGEVLVRLDDTVTGADAELSGLSVNQLLAQRARLEAERLGSDSIRFPAGLTRSGDPGARQAIADERRLFALRRGESGGIVSQLRARVVQYERQIDGYGAQIEALRQQQALLKPEREGVRELWEKDLVTINRLNQLERTSADLTGSIASLQSDIAQTQARITEARQQIIQVGQTRRSDAGGELTALNATLNQQQVRSVSAGDTQDRSVIRAPYDGTVDKLMVSAVGDVVRPAETILEIVPADDELVVEATVSPVDIDQVRDGQPVRIRFSAFSMATTPEYDGRVTFVAPERTRDEATGASFYPVRVAIAPGAGELPLRPGMPAEVFIETGDRSMLSYMTKPIRDQFARAFKDSP